MTIHQIFQADHRALRKRIQEVQQVAMAHCESLDSLFKNLHAEARAHFRKEDEVYYPYIDQNKKIADRELMHTLRNDHAAVVFALESLAIRLRKRVPIDEWKTKFQTLTAVLLPHFDAEEIKLFPEVERILPAAELELLLKQVRSLQ